MRTGVSSMTPAKIGPGSPTGSVTIGSPASGPGSVEEEDGRIASLEECGRPDVVELDSIRLYEELEGATEELDSRCPVSMLEPDSGSRNSGGISSPEVTSSESIS